MSDSTIVLMVDEEITYRTDRIDTAGLRAGLLAARAFVGQSAAGLDIATLENQVVAGEWTMRDIVGHLADWDARTRTGILQALGSSNPGDLSVPDFDALNTEMVASRRERGDRWEDVTRDLATSLDATLALLDGISEEQLALPVTLPWGRESTLLDAFGVFEFHVEEHHGDLRAASVDPPPS